MVSDDDLTISDRMCQLLKECPKTASKADLKQLLLKLTGDCFDFDEQLDQTAKFIQLLLRREREGQQDALNTVSGYSNIKVEHSITDTKDMSVI